jgi:hypothetical protein
MFLSLFSYVWFRSYVSKKSGYPLVYLSRFYGIIEVSIWILFLFISLYHLLQTSLVNLNVLFILKNFSLIFMDDSIFRTNRKNRSFLDPGTKNRSFLDPSVCIHFYVCVYVYIEFYNGIVNNQRVRYNWSCCC